MIPVDLCYLFGLVTTCVLTTVLYARVLPRKLDGSLNNKFLQFLHDYFHFKKLYIEEVLKFIFVIASVFCVCTGTFLILGYREVNSLFSESTQESTIGIGIALVLGGPISLRLTYELLMMFILAVKNIMEINNKISKKEACAEASSAQTAYNQTIIEPAERSVGSDAKVTNQWNEQYITNTITSLYDMIQDARNMPLDREKCVLDRDKALDMLDETIEQLAQLGLWKETQEVAEDNHNGRQENFMEMKSGLGTVVWAEKECDVYCPICHKILHVEEDQVIPRCCGQVMQEM